MTNLHLVEIRSCIVPVPPADVQKNIVKAACAFDQSLVGFESEINSLGFLRSQIIENELKGAVHVKRRKHC